MSVGRNDPCPCGSGKKYKRCCERLERTAGASAEVAGRVRSAALAAAAWEADIVAFPGALQGVPTARLGLLLVVADGFAVRAQPLEAPSAEPAAMADALAEALVVAGRDLGDLPPKVLVRDAEVATALAARLGTLAAESGTRRRPVVEAGAIPGFDEVAFGFVEHATGQSFRFFLSRPETWAAWGLPEEQVAGIFRHAAAFYRAAPWQKLANDDGLTASMPGGNRWTACVLGAGGEEYGLNLYSAPEDYAEAVDAWEPEAAFRDLRGRIINLAFDARADLPKAMRRELAESGWEIAGPRAHPQLFTINSPAGGLRQRDAEDLAALLAAIPRFVAALPQTLSVEEAFAVWRDVPTGIELTCHTVDVEGGEPPELAPGGPEGPAARPAAALAGYLAAHEDPDAFSDEQLSFVERFAAHLTNDLELQPSTVAKHRHNAEDFVQYLGGCGVPVCAVHEHDLRSFLFDYGPRKAGMGVARAAALPTSLVRFFDYLTSREGIVCPWAAAILADRETIEERWHDVPVGGFWDEDVAAWRGEHYSDLEHRLMLPDSALGERMSEESEGERWGATMGYVEARLYGELCRRWLIWRDELLRDAGTYGDVLLALIARQREWERTVHPDLDGKNPLEAIREERARRSQREG